MMQDVRLIFLIFEILDRTHAAHDDVRVDFLHIIRQQARECIDADIRQMRRRFFEEALALLDGEEPFLAHVVKDADDEFVKQAARALEDVDMADGHGVEAARADSNAVAHTESSPT